MEKEFNLSEKIEDEIGNRKMLDIEDVREFIKKLKEMFKPTYTDSPAWEQMCKDIDKLAGEKLI